MHTSVASSASVPRVIPHRRLPRAGAAALLTPWGVLAAALFVAACVLLTLEQRLAEHVDLAFFKINVWVGAVVFAIVLAARLAAGGL